MPTVQSPNDSSAATAAAALAAKQAAAAATSNSQGMRDQFLTLLVTQLKNQDPLNPLENAQLTSQLAQISTVEGMEKLNANISTSLDVISGQIDFSQSVAAVNMIGKDVLVPGTKVSLGTHPSDPSQRNATPFGVDLRNDAASLEVKILNANGDVVRTLSLQNQKVGVIGLSWDGLNEDGVPAPDGDYTLSVGAKDSAGTAISQIDPLTYGRVSSVGYTAKGLMLDLGLAGQFGLLDVRKVFNT